MNILDQAFLRELEDKCVQEQPPPAMSACPLHVDCRALCAAISAEDFDAARAIYTGSVPFPGILSRLCRMPCGKSCVREQLGGSIHLRALEQAAMTYGKARPKRSLPLRKSGTAAAVVGAGLCGLTAALELGKKGYCVTVFEKAAAAGGGILRSGLPGEVLAEALDTLKAYSITFRFGEAVTDALPLLSEYGAVLLAPGERPTVGTDPLTLLTAQPGLFAAGGFDSAVFSMEAGKRAAISMDRYIKKVSLTAGREGEGSFESSLYVETARTRPAAPEPAPESLQGAIREAARCLDCKCMECARGCAFISHFKRYPRKYVREVYNNLSIAMGNRTANTLINSCALCAQCAAICPSGLDLGEVMRAAREIMVQTNKMPVSAFEFAVNDLHHANGESAFVLRNQPGFERSKYLFFPGCQLGASAPQVVRNAYRHLTGALNGGVGLMLSCCGITARWAGQEALFQDVRESLLRGWEALGRPQIITACPTCRKTLEGDFGETTDLWTLLLDIGLPPGVPAAGSYTIHDACGARDEKSSRDNVRRLLRRMGCEVVEPEFSGERSPCCGYGGLVQFSNAEVAEEMTRLCTRDVDGQRLTYCMNCRDRFTKAGSRAVHILELIYGGEQASDRAAPGYSLRHDNREGLKREMLSEFWNEKQAGPDRLPLIYDAELAELLEKRLILEDEIRQVISDALESGSFLRDGVSGLMIASRRIGSVTFWVHFRPENSAWRVCRAYSHRMEMK